MNLDNYECGDIHFVFDKYDEPSTKDSERLRRATDNAIEYSSLSLTTELPRNMDTF